MDLINYAIQGEGKPVILIHGMAASMHDWVYLVPDLNKAGYKTYALDLPGHGGSHKPDGSDGYLVDYLYEQLASWLESLALPQPPVLIGHSLGGTLSLILAVKRPELASGLVLIDPYYDPSQLSLLLRVSRRLPALAVQALRLAPQWVLQSATYLPLGAMGHLTAEVRRQRILDLKQASPQVMRIPYSLPDLNGDLEKIKMPSLVIWGESDTTLKPVSFPRLVSTLQNARSGLVPNSDHQPHIEQPVMTNRLILDFLHDL